MKDILTFCQIRYERPPYSAASTGAMSQLHSSTMTGGYVPHPEGGAQTQHSQLGKDVLLATCITIILIQ